MFFEVDLSEQHSQLYALELVTAPTEEPCTLGELRSSLRLTQTQDDTEIASIWVPAARALIEKSLGVRLVTQTWRVYFDHFPAAWGLGLATAIDRVFDSSNVLGMPVIWSELPIGPVQSVTSIKYLDLNGVEQTLSPSVYSTDTKRPMARICLNTGQVFPATQMGVPNTVRVQFVCGYGARQALPQNLRAAVMLQAKAMYEGEDELTETVKRLAGLEWSGSLDVKT